MKIQSCMVKTREFLNIFQANKGTQYIFSEEQEFLLRDLIAQLRKHLTSCQTAPGPTEETCQKEFECECDDCQKLIQDCNCKQCRESRAQIIK